MLFRSVFLRAADAGSFSEAAEMRRITPTAVIKPIMRRECSLGVKRFGRSRRGPVLAKAGLSLYQDAAQTLRKERYG